MDPLRLKAILEIVDTEVQYVEDLKTIIQCFQEPLMQRFPDNKALRVVFGNLKELHRVNGVLAEKLDKLTSSSRKSGASFYIGSTFLEYAQKLHVYDVYCKNYDRALVQLQSLMEDTAFSVAVEQQRVQNTVRVKGLLLHDFLIKPVQRICKYPLLFKQLLHYTPPDNPDYDLLQQAQARMEEVAASVNRARAQSKNHEEIAAISQTLEGYPHGDLASVPRRLLRAGPLVKLSPKGEKQERQFWLFSDVLIYAARKKSKFEFKDQIELNAVLVRNVTQAAKGLQAKDVDSGFELVRLDKKKKVYTILARDAGQKASWVKALSVAIDQVSKARERAHEGIAGAVNELDSLIQAPSTPSMEMKKSPRGFLGRRRGDSKYAGTEPTALPGGAPSATDANMAALKALRAVAQQASETEKMLEQANLLQADLQEKVARMMRMLELERSARQKIEEQLKNAAGSQSPRRSTFSTAHDSSESIPRVTPSRTASRSRPIKRSNTSGRLNMSGIKKPPPVSPRATKPVVSPRSKSPRPKPKLGPPPTGSAPVPKGPPSPRPRPKARTVPVKPSSLTRGKQPRPALPKPDPQPEPEYCVNCGTQLPAGSSVCSECGTDASTYDGEYAYAYEEEWEYT